MRAAAMSMLAFAALILFTSCNAQDDGNPHNWDRMRRCDEGAYDPPCGVCEGYGGIAYGNENDQIELATCEPIASAADIDPSTVKPVEWGTIWQISNVQEVLITKKMDPFCFSGFPGPDSIGELCYARQNGTKVYDMGGSKTFHQILDVATAAGETRSEVTHNDQNFWIVNHIPIGEGKDNEKLYVDQCICTRIHNGNGPDLMYPVNPEWVKNLVFVGREKLSVEFIDQTIELDHWAYGPHHAWTYPETGQLLRMWQPFNGLQVYPDGVAQGEVDPDILPELPPAKCRLGGAPLRVKCTDDGYPLPEEDEPEKELDKQDKWRAETKIPRHNYRGIDFSDMSKVLNGWLNSTASSSSKTGLKTKSCELWDMEELQRLQALIYLMKESSFDGIYQATGDNRRLRHDLLQDIDNTWYGLNELANGHSDPMVKRIRRDGHCHEAVMWFVHHLTADLKALIEEFQIEIPLLSPMRHDCDDSDDSAHGEVCRAYKKQVTCADCHSKYN